MLCKKAEPMISGYLDNELTQQESQQLRIHLEDCADCQAVCADMRELKQQVGGLSYPEPVASEHSRLDELESDLFSSTATGIGWLLLSLAGAGLFIFGLVAFFTTADVPVLIKLLHGAMVGGGLLLFIVVLRQRLKERKTDKYRKVKL